jgi:hypothetical protein
VSLLQMHPPGFLIRTSATSPSPGFPHTAALHPAPPAGPPTAPSSPYRSSQYSPGPPAPQPVQHSPAPASVERELRALRLAREEYQHALLEQERIRNKLLSSIERKLEVRCTGGSLRIARSIEQRGCLHHKHGAASS